MASFCFPELSPDICIRGHSRQERNITLPAAASELAAPFHGHPEDPAHFSRARDLARSDFNSPLASIDNPIRPLYLSSDSSPGGVFVNRKMIQLALLAISFSLSSWAQSNAVGIFEGHSDVGTVLHPGSVDYDDSQKTYTITGSGENMWLGADAFQFVWKKISGDATLTADVRFLGTGGNEHRKAVLMLRQNLGADSVYADIARHGNGMTSLQFRTETGGLTHEIQANIPAPTRLRIVKRGDYVYMSLSGDGERVHVAGGWLRVPIEGPFYVGIGVCSHNKDVIEKALFSNVDLIAGGPAPTGQPALYSTLEKVSITSTDRQVVYISPGRFEAPNWTRDGKSFLFNREGHIERLPVIGGRPEIVDTGLAARCNNDHGISPDGTQLAISDNSQEKHDSLVYLVPIGGGAPRRITQNSPSYWHGWSPDGKTLAFVGQRNGDFDIYIIPADSGSSPQAETRLTTAKGLDDGPEYSPDGKYIYFNSERTGHMQIWRMRPDGSEQELVFSDDYNNWFPHISPDGQWMVFLTYDKDVTGHPENKDVKLRAMSLADKKITVLATLFGGQGTINVPSWSPDSKQVAFVSYQLVPEEK
jgi:TolB protein